MDFDEVADELFGLAPPDFIRVRDARAKTARAGGDRELATQITALRKPTNVAWLANQLARERPEQVKPFLALGESLREATAALSGPELRELSRQRQQLVHALVREARTLSTGDRPRVTEDISRGLEETLHAALADPASAEILAAGRLSTGLRHSGFGGPPSGFGGPPSKPPVKPPPKKTTSAEKDRGDGEVERRAAQRQQLEESLAQAWSEARSAAESRDAATRAAEEANQAYDDAAARVRALEKDLQTLQRALEEAGQARDSARRTRAQARDGLNQSSRQSDTARRVVTDLQSRLDAL